MRVSAWERKDEIKLSVVEPERHKGRLEVHVKAQALAAYTALILKNPKVFDPEIDTEIINRIRNCAYDIYVKSWSANKIKADTNQINREMRYQTQEEAIRLCDEMLAYIGIAKARYYQRLWEGAANESSQAKGTNRNAGTDKPDAVRYGDRTEGHDGAR